MRLPTIGALVSILLAAACAAPGETFVASGHELSEAMRLETVLRTRCDAIHWGCPVMIGEMAPASCRFTSKHLTAKCDVRAVDGRLSRATIYLWRSSEGSPWFGKYAGARPR